ncbi:MULTISPECIES: C40 family peptidase [Clostridium]|uniref:C40 family peptidase n=1 Tax=Clostridium TaxID=1485 RepID=UPI000825E30E|nr:MULTISPECIES: C40 family peptidase [Clostridium]PJI07213.1 glycoside hydrolase [Clostridium sp. CT7]
MKKTIKTVMLATVLVMVTQVSAFAAPISNQAQTQLEQNKNSLKKAQDTRHELEASIEELDNQIEDYMIKIEGNKKSITKAENDIENTKKQITQVEEEVKIKQYVFSQRVRAIYINGESSYLNILLDSESFSDLISKTEMIGKIIGMDKKVIGDLNDMKAEVKSKKASLDAKYNGLNALKSENENKLTSLNSRITDQKKLIEDAKVQEKLYASKVDESQASVNAAMKTVINMRSEAPSVNYSRGIASVATASDNSIIAYASNFLGTPYLWGGTSPSTGFDCSGFTQYVYAHFGISLGRTTYDQINDGYGVPRDQLQPGDLVFFGKNGDPTHMGMYVGNNTYIHSPRTGDVIKISSMGRPDYITARRVK